MDINNDFISLYNEKVTKENHDEVVNAFLDNYSEWKKLLGHPLPGHKDGDREYGNALNIFAVAISFSKTISQIDFLNKEICFYDISVKGLFEVKVHLYNNLGLSWYHVGEDYHEQARLAFRKYVYYWLLSQPHSNYFEIQCFSFRPCTKYLFHTLSEEKLNLSSPTTFNDPFDCPLLTLFKENELAQIVKTAYIEGLRVSCFSRSLNLPHVDHNDVSGMTIIRDEVKNKNQTECENMLMWSHYADSHRGICIKYRFPSAISAIEGERSYVSFFTDIRYTEDLEAFNKRDSIDVINAFFAKRKEWEYEQELRLLYYNPYEQGLYSTIDIPNCIEAIYFGIKCSIENKHMIKKLMKDRLYGIRQPRNIYTSQEEKTIYEPVHFFQMKMNDSYGTIEAEFEGYSC